MALPFIVGPRQFTLTHGPEGYPQVEVTLRLRLPVAEFIDAILLSTTEQQSVAWQPGKGANCGRTTTAKAEPSFSARKGGSKSAEARGDAQRAGKESSASASLPKVCDSAPRTPNRYTKQTPAVDPAHARLLKALSTTQAMHETRSSRSRSPSSDGEGSIKQRCCQVQTWENPSAVQHTLPPPPATRGRPV